MKYSIVIPTYNNLLLTKKCLNSVFNNTKGDFSVAIVDDGSRDGTIDFLKSQNVAKYFINKTNKGFARNCNFGSEKADGEVLIFLNNDTEVQSGWLEAIDEVFQKEENVGAVGVKLLFPNGTIQHAGLVIAEDHIPRHIYYKSDPGIPEVNKQRDFQAVTAACIAIPKKVFEEIGGFDEAYVNGMEDVDLCMRIKKAGYRIIYTPKSVVVHHESVSPGRFDKNKHNADLYMSRWRDAVPDEHEYYKRDGKSAWWIFLKDLRTMSYGPSEYHTRPLYISILRWVYIPLQKVYTVTTLLAKGDLREIGKKIIGKFTRKEDCRVVPPRNDEGGLGSWLATRNDTEKTRDDKKRKR